MVPNRQVSGDTVTFHSVTVANTGVYQCNASNQYGYLFANAYISVLSKIPYSFAENNHNPLCLLKYL